MHGYSKKTFRSGAGISITNMGACDRVRCITDAGRASPIVPPSHKTPCPRERNKVGAGAAMPPPSNPPAPLLSSPETIVRTCCVNRRSEPARGPEAAGARRAGSSAFAVSSQTTDCGFQGMAKGSTTMAVRGACGAGRIVVENDAYRDVEGCISIRNANVTVVSIHWALPPSVKSAASCDAAQQ